MRFNICSGDQELVGICSTFVEALDTVLDSSRKVLNVVDLLIDGSESYRWSLF